MKKITLFLFLCISLQVYSQVTISPTPFSANQTITISVDTNSSDTNCNKFSNPTKVYMHSGVGTDANPWTYVQGNWGQDDGVGLMSDADNDGIWTIEINPKTYYNLTDAQVNSITKMGLVFRNENGSQEFKDNGCNDFFFNVGSFQLTLNSPTTTSTILNTGETITISASSSANADFALKANGTTIHTASNTTTYTHSPTVNENIDFVLEATSNGHTISKEFKAFIVPTTTEAAVPAGMKDGINLNPTDNTKATLVFYAPGKKFVHLIGSFNNWNIDDANYLLKKDSAKDRFWIEVSGLTPQTDYSYQYLIERKTRVADPYSTVILTEHNDQYINATTYPNLPAYPTGKTNHAVTLLRTGDTPYTWKTTNFKKPAKEDLVIYELLIRDFDDLHSFDAVKARLDYLQNLGVNAIEFLPVMEFDGNESWGYNPSFHMALDKYYGNRNSFKSLIDECHARGIAVIIDVAFNHASGQNPYYRMWNTDNGGYVGQASPDSPFFNQTATHSYSVFNDFNHSKQATKDYVKRIAQYWIEEYKIDGFRWDLTKGFTQNCTNNESCTNNYQQDRVDVLKEYADYQWEIDPNFYVIFEHLGGNTEESQWINYRLNEGKGIMVWGNHNHNYRNAIKGENSGSDFSWISYKNRGWSAPMNVSYMESHDEERLAYDALQNGKSSGGYNVRNLATALDRLNLSAAFFFTVPGPKMIWQFGELGYDVSINFNGRTGNKPIRWDYFSNTDRKKVYDTWSKLIQLKHKYQVFKTSTFVMDVGNSSGLKRINLTDNNSPSDLKYVTIIGNFGVTTQNINPQFQQTGTWYNLLDNNSSINVTDTHAMISLAPGEYRIYGSSQATLSTDDINNITKLTTVYPNPTDNNLHLTVDAKQVIIFDTLGRKVKAFKGNLIAGKNLDVSDLKRGLYLLKIDGKNNLLKFIKN